MSDAKITTAIALAPTAEMFRQLSHLTEGGFTPAEAVAVLKEDEESKRLAATLEEIARDLEDRGTLADALERHAASFGTEVVAIVRTAEQRGTLPAALAMLADDFDRRLQLSKGLPVMLFWPAFLLVFLGFVTMLLMIFVIPAFKDVYSSFGADLPALTLLVMAFSDVIASYWYVVIVLIAALPFGVAWLRRQPGTGAAIDGVFLKIPGVRRFLVKLLVGRMAALLSGAAACGIPAVVATAYLRSTLRNRHLAGVIGEIERDLAQGVPLSAAWRKQRLLPRGFAQLVEIGERTKKLEHVLARAAPVYALEAAAAVSVFRQVLIIGTYVLAGLIVGFVVIAMYLPIFKLGQAV